MKLLLLLLAFVGSSFADPCPTFTLQPNFKIAKYTGLWYEIDRIPNSFETGTKCDTARYELNPNGTLTVVEAATTLKGQHISYKGLAVVINPKVPAALKLIYGPSEVAPYNILATDYEHYAVVYSCNINPKTGVKTELGYIISRQKTLQPIYLKEAKKVFIDNDVDICKLVPTAQNC